MELFFAKLFGLYFVIVGAIIFVRRDAVMPTVKSFANERALLMVLAIIEIVAGLALILAFPGFTLPDLAGWISLIGYMLVIEGILYLAAPAKTVRTFIGFFNRPFWYMIGGALSVFAGLYLAGKGFGYL